MSEMTTHMDAPSGILQQDYPEIFSAPVWDRERALQRVGGRETRLAHLINLFIADMVELLDSLEQVIEQEQLDVAGHQVHSIKGVAGNLSAIRLQSLAKAMETTALNGDAEQLKLLWSLFKEQSQQLIAELEPAAQELSSSTG